MGKAPGASERFVWIDALRLCAGLSMVILHATSDAAGQPFAQYDPSERIAPMLLRTLAYTARTELFLMISVFLLLLALDRRPRDYGQTLAEQARRLLIPFVFWTLFYAGFRLLKAAQFGYLDAAFEPLLTGSAWVGFLLLGDVKYHMHFIPTLFGILLLYPLYKYAYRRPLLGLWILVALLIKREVDGFIFATYWNTDVLPFLVRAVKILTYTGYGMAAAALLGLWQQVPCSKRQAIKPALWILASGLFAIKLIATHQTIQTGAWPFDYTPGYYADFLMPLVLMALVMCLTHDRWSPKLSQWAPYSFGIYLAHPIFLDGAEILLSDVHWAPIWIVLGKVIIVLPATVAFVHGLARIPIMAWTIGMGGLPNLWTVSQKLRRL